MEGSISISAYPLLYVPLVVAPWIQLCSTVMLEGRWVTHRIYDTHAEHKIEPRMR